MTYSTDNPMNAYCIHLPHRTDRKLHMDEMGIKYPSIRLHYVDGVYNSDGVTGCNLSHKRVISDAKTRGDPYVLVLEDDCDILVSDTVLAKYLDTIDDFLRIHPDVEIVNGCGNLIDFTISSKIRLNDMHFLTSNPVYTAHFIIYCARSYDKILNSPTNVAIDVITNQCNMVFTYPYLATQLQSYSDIMKIDVSYSNIIKSRDFVRNEIESTCEISI